MLSGAITKLIADVVCYEMVCQRAAVYLCPGTNPLNPSEREQNKRMEAVNMSDQPLSLTWGTHSGPVFYIGHQYFNRVIQC